jgi:hypothetical protein
MARPPWPVLHKKLMFRGSALIRIIGMAMIIGISDEVRAALT